SKLFITASVIVALLNVISVTVNPPGTSNVCMTASLIDKVPLTEPSTTDRFCTHKSDIQFVTSRLSITASVIVALLSVISLTVNPPKTSKFCMTASLIDKVPLTEPSTTDRFCTHKSVIQFVTSRLSITASVIVALLSVISLTVNPPKRSKFCMTASLIDKVPLTDPSTTD